MKLAIVGSVLLAGNVKALEIIQDMLDEYKPDVVIAMNPIYCDEIRRDLEAMSLHPELVAL